AQLVGAATCQRYQPRSLSERLPARGISRAARRSGYLPEVSAAQLVGAAACQRYQRWPGSRWAGAGPDRPVPWTGGQTRPARQAPGLLRRRRPGGADRRGGAEALRPADLRAQTDRAQQARGGDAGGPRRDLRGGERGG